MKTRLPVIISFIFLILLFNINPVHAQDTSITLGSTSIDVSEQANLPLQAINIDNLGSFQLTITWDPTELELNDIQELSSFSLSSYIDHDIGKVTIVGYSIDGKTGSINLATLVFTPLGQPGDTAIVHIQDCRLLSADPKPVQLSHTTKNGTIQIKDSINTDTILSLSDIQFTQERDQISWLQVNEVEQLGSFQINITWDPTIVDLNQVQEADFSLSTYIHHHHGYVNIVGYSMDAKTGSFDLALLDFTAVGAPGDSCSLTIITSRLYTADPKPTNIQHLTKNGHATIDHSAQQDAQLIIDDIALAPGRSQNSKLTLEQVNYLGSFLINISWDPTVVNLTMVDGHNEFYLACYGDYQHGYLHMVGYSINEQSGTLDLADLTFTAKGNPGDHCLIAIADSRLLSAHPKPQVIDHDRHHGQAIIIGETNQDSILTVTDLNIPEHENNSTNVSLSTIDRIGSFLINISYDPTVIDIIDVTPSQDVTVYSTISHHKGYATLLGYTDEGKTGLFTLAQLTIQAKGTTDDTSPLTITTSQLLSADPKPIQIQHVTDHGQATITKSNSNDDTKDTTETTLTLSDTTIPPGGQNTSTISVQNVNNLGSFQLNITWDPTVIDLTDVSEAADFTVSYYSSSSHGYANIIGYTMSGKSGSFDLADLEFDAIGAAGSSCDLLFASSELLTADPQPADIVHLSVDAEAVIDDGSGDDQTTVSIADTNIPADGSNTSLITVFNVDNLGSFEMNISYDPTVVDILSVSDASAFTVSSYVNHGKGYVNLNGYAMDGQTGSFDLVNITFDAIGEAGDYCDLIFIESMLYTADPQPSSIAHTSDDGYAEIKESNGGGTQQTTVTIDDIAIPSGGTQTTSVSITAVENLGSFQINITWSPSIVDLTAVSEAADFTVSEYINHDQGYVNLIGYTLNGKSGSFDLADLEFDAIGAAGSSCDLLFASSELLTADPQPVDIVHLSVDAEAVIDDGSGDDQTTVNIAEITLTPGGSKTIPVIASTVDNLGSFEMNISYDPTVVDILSVSDASAFTVSSYVNHGKGYVNLNGYAMDGQTGNVNLASLNIKAIGTDGKSCDLMIQHCILLNADPQPSTIAHLLNHGSVSIKQETTNDDGGGSNGGGGGFTAPQNNPPEADLSAGAPYTGNVNEFIRFDATLSSDSDGTIISWFWNFGDGTNATGQNPSHQYQTAGTYTVGLTVTDDDNATDTATTSVIITQPNRPPSTPSITGEIMGSTDTSYVYSFGSTDADNDTIRYHINWDDGTSDSTNHTPSDTKQTMSHQWNTPGIYTLSIQAEDQYNATSSQATMNIFIDVLISYINGTITGYLIDEDNDGVYERFHNNATDDDCTVEQHTEGSYLIDSDNDGNWNYAYNMESDSLESYSSSTPNEEDEPMDFTGVYALIGIIVLLLIVFGYFTMQNKKK